MEFLFIAVGCIFGLVIAFLFFKSKQNANHDTSALDTKIVELEKEKIAADEKLKNAVDSKKEISDELTEHRKKLNDANIRLAKAEEAFENQKEKLATLKSELENINQKFTTEFKNIANTILNDNSKKFTEQNKTQIDDILKPLGEKIKDFEKRVNEVYSDETKERTALKHQLVELLQKNQQLSKDAQNLTNALKGENKSAGNWGEMILQSILEKSGLRKDEQYRAQKSFTSEDGKIFQPDVIIDLPGNKSLVVDSKVSLVAYERFASAENEDEKVVAIKEHVASVRKHIKDLSDKNYQKIYQLNTLDFILLFMPIEPAFSTALQNDRELFNYAFDKNIVIVSPTTLLATLRTVDNFWKQELQNRNVLQIADEAAAMYEKFVGFTEAMIEVGKKMDSSKDSYQTAMNRLSTGTGNVVRRIENLKKLGLKVSKSIDPKLVKRSNESDLPEENEKQIPSKFIDNDEPSLLTDDSDL